MRGELTVICLRHKRKVCLNGEWLWHIDAGPCESQTFILRREEREINRQTTHAELIADRMANGSTPRS